MRKLPVVASCALAVAALVSGCTSSAAQEHPAQEDAGQASRAVATPDPAPTSSAPTSGAPAPSAAAELTGSLDGRPATLAVTVGAEAHGLPPLETMTGPLAATCHLDPATAEYVPVVVRFGTAWQPTKGTGDSANLRMDVAVPGGSGTGLVLADSTGVVADCSAVTAPPAQVTVQTQNLSQEHQTITLYVVARTAPGGADPLHGVPLRVHDLRHHPDDIDAGAWTWGVQRVTAGSACPGDPNSLCAPLG